MMKIKEKTYRNSVDKENRENTIIMIMGLSPAIFIVLMVILGLYFYAHDQQENTIKRISIAEKLIQSQDPSAKLIKDTVEFQGKSATAKVVFGSTYKTCVFPDLKSVVCNAA